MLKEEKYQSRILYPVKLSSKSEGQILFSDKQEMRELVDQQTFPARRVKLWSETWNHRKKERALEENK